MFNTHFRSQILGPLSSCMPYTNTKDITIKDVGLFVSIPFTSDPIQPLSAQILFLFYFFFKLIVHEPTVSHSG